MSSKTKTFRKRILNRIFLKKRAYPLFSRLSCYANDVSIFFPVIVSYNSMRQWLLDGARWHPVTWECRRQCGTAANSVLVTPRSWYLSRRHDGQPVRESFGMSDLAFTYFGVLLLPDAVLAVSTLGRKAGGYTAEPLHWRCGTSPSSLPAISHVCLIHCLQIPRLWGVESIWQGAGRRVSALT